MKTVTVLELFKGGGSVSHFLTHTNLARFKIVSLDINCKYQPDICEDILKWHYKKEYPPGYFDIIWASPDCTEYSIAKTRSPRNMDHADKLVKRTLNIIKYFRPKVWIIENPKTGYLKSRPFMEGIPYYDVTYCKYGYDYKKPTRLWTNIKDFSPKYCRSDCGKMINGKHIRAVGIHDRVQRPWLTTISIPLYEKYSIPRDLLHDLFSYAVRQLSSSNHRTA